MQSLAKCQQQERIIMKSERNRTIDISVEEGREYLGRCITEEQILSAAKDGKTDISSVLNKTICGDTFRIMPLLPSAFADLVIVDPPYNLEKNFHGNVFRESDEEEYERYTNSWLDLVEPLMKPNATIYVCSDWKTSMVIGRVLARRLRVQNRITWQREKGRGALHNWKNGMEDIWFATKSKDYLFNVEKVMQRRRVIAPYKIDGKPKDWEQTEEGNFRNTYPSNFWDDISIPYWSMPENTAHPTQKPEKLLAKLILASSNEGDVVLDPFGGSGSTAVTAQKLGRNFVSIEQNELYCVWAEKRLETAKEDNSIQGYADGVFWERNTAQRRKK